MFSFLESENEKKTGFFSTSSLLASLTNTAATGLTSVSSSYGNFISTSSNLDSGLQSTTGSSTPTSSSFTTNKLLFFVGKNDNKEDSIAASSAYTSSSSISSIASSPSSKVDVPLSSSSSLLKAHSTNSFARFLLENNKCNGITDLLFPSQQHQHHHPNHHKHSLLFRCLQVIVFLLRCITPLAYGYLVYLYYNPSLLWWYPSSLVYRITMIVITVIMICEVLFFPYYYYLFRCYNNRYNHSLKHLCQDRQSRMKLVKQCFESMGLSAPASLPLHLHLRKVLEGWFLDVPLIYIYFGNMASWTAWAFFGRNIRDMTFDKIQENADIVHYIETIIQWKFPLGMNMNSQIFALRLNLDPIFVTQRPFIFYGSIYVVTQLTHVYLYYCMGFTCLKDFSYSGQKIYYRRADDTTAPAEKEEEADNDETKKKRNNKNQNKKKKLPIVFIHGIGTGFSHYLALISGFPKDVDVFLVEWPYVAMQMTTSAPTADESIAAIVKVLDHYQHEQAVFVAHSLGTVCVSWMLHDPIGALKVANTIMLDPITFILCDPTVASVFVYKDPIRSMDLLMHFFLSRELYISNALSRHFSWSYNILFVEELLNSRKCCQQYSHQMLPICNATTTLQQQECLPCSTTIQQEEEQQQQHTRIRTRTMSVDEKSSAKSEISDDIGRNRNESISTQQDIISPVKNLNDDDDTVLKHNVRDSFINNNAIEDNIDKIWKCINENDEKEWRKHHKTHKDVEHTIILATNDMIVPTSSVSRYLMAKQKQGFVNFELIVFEGTHGEVTLLPKWLKFINKRIYAKTHPKQQQQTITKKHQQHHRKKQNSDTLDGHHSSKLQ